MDNQVPQPPQPPTSPAPPVPPLPITPPVAPSVGPTNPDYYYDPYAPHPIIVRFRQYAFELTNRRIVLGSVGILGSLLLVFGLIWVVVRPDKARDIPNLKVVASDFPTPTPTPEPSPTPVPAAEATAAPLTGLDVTNAAAQLPIAGIIIENLYPDARPQSGLAQAGIVYEALAEGGITRFLALYQAPYPKSIGPVRSLRPYYLDWGLEYNVPIAHAGGSEPALKSIIPLGMKDINALMYDGSFFVRIRDRKAPHNLYTTAPLLEQVIAKLGFNQSPTFTPLLRKVDEPAANPLHTSIKIPFSSNAYLAEYRYQASSNSYLRYQGGIAQTDRNTGRQIEVKNLVVEFIPVTYGKQSNGKPDTRYDLIGNGRALVFRDGGVVNATWSKSSHAAPTKILDPNGQPVVFNKGNTWFSAVPTNTKVTY